MIYVETFFWILVGIAIGAVIGFFRFYRRPMGIITVDTTEPDEEPYLYLSIAKDDLNTVLNKNRITLEVHKYSEPNSPK